MKRIVVHHSRFGGSGPVGWDHDIHGGVKLMGKRDQGPGRLHLYTKVAASVWVGVRGLVEFARGYVKHVQGETPRFGDGDSKGTCSKRTRSGNR